MYAQILMCACTRLIYYHGCETWTITKMLAKRLDGFDTWCLQKICVFRTLGILLTKQCEASPSAHQCRAGSYHFGWGSSGTLLMWFPRRSITVSLSLLIGGGLLGPQELPGWGQLMMTFSPWILGSTRLGGRQETMFSYATIVIGTAMLHWGVLQ